MFRARLILIAFLVFAFSITSYAQSGSIQGVVVDAGGATVPDAKVTALDIAKQLVVRETVTAQDGVLHSVRSCRAATR